MLRSFIVRDTLKTNFIQTNTEDNLNTIISGLWYIFKIPPPPNNANQDNLETAMDRQLQTHITTIPTGASLKSIHQEKLCNLAKHF